ncbi:MAG: DUF47 family protein [Clostridiales bacterium]
MIGVQKKEGIFYELFCEQINMILETGEFFYQWILDYENQDVEKMAAIMSDKEQECDEETRKIMRQLNNSFITPFDREDIYLMIKCMDRVVDNMEKVASSFYIYSITKMEPAVFSMVEKNLTSIKGLKVMFDNLKDFKKTDMVLKQIIEVNRLENEGDHIYRHGLKQLFEDKQDGLELMKWHRIYDYLEKGLDSCEEVANVVEGVVMKHA